MKNILLLISIVLLSIFYGCKKEEDKEVKICGINNQTVPVLIENTSFGDKNYGYSSLGVEKGDYDAFVVTTSTTSPNYPNFVGTTTIYTPANDVNGDILNQGEYNGKEYWFIKANFESTDASINYTVHLECTELETENTIISQTSDLTISSPTLCELMDTYTLYESIYDGIPASKSTVNIRLATNQYNGSSPLNRFVFENGITIKATPEFDGITEPSRELSFPSVKSISAELDLDLFELTGYNKTNWPGSHNDKGRPVNIILEVKICGKWYPIGTVIWQSLG